MRDWSWAEVEIDFQGARRALLRAIRELPADRLEDAVIRESIAEETCEHYQQHIPELEQWRAQLVDSRISRRG